MNTRSVDSPSGRAFARASRLVHRAAVALLTFEQPVRVGQRRMWMSFQVGIAKVLSLFMPPILDPCSIASPS